MEAILRRRVHGRGRSGVDGEAEALVEEALRHDAVLNGANGEDLGIGIENSKVNNIFDEDKHRFEEIFKAVNGSETKASRVSEELDAVAMVEEVEPLRGPREDEQFCELSPRRPRVASAEERRRLSEEFEAEISSAEEGGVFYAPDRAPPLFDFLTIMTAFLVACFAAYYSINI